MAFRKRLSFCLGSFEKKTLSFAFHLYAGRQEEKVFIFRCVGDCGGLRRFCVGFKYYAFMLPAFHKLKKGSRIDLIVLLITLYSRKLRSLQLVLIHHIPRYCSKKFSRGTCLKITDLFWLKLNAKIWLRTTVITVRLQ